MICIYIYLCLYLYLLIVYFLKFFPENSFIVHPFVKEKVSISRNPTSSITSSKVSDW